MKIPAAINTATLKKIAITAASGALVFLLLAPLIVLIASSISGRGWQYTTSEEVLAALGISAITTVLTSLITVMLGTPLAYVLARWQFPLRRIIAALVELPIVLPPAVAGLALLLTFGRRGVFGPTLAMFGITLPFSTTAVIIAQTFISAPIYIRAAQVAIRQIPREIEDAARVDGASGLALLRYVMLPLARNGLAAGLTLSWARALGEFGATIIFAGRLNGTTQTMPLLVYNILESNTDAAIWTSVILVALALAALLISHWLSGRGGENDQIAV